MLKDMRSCKWHYKTILGISFLFILLHQQVQMDKAGAQTL